MLNKINPQEIYLGMTVTNQNHIHQEIKAD
jgi:hypothetical protein